MKKKFVKVALLSVLTCGLPATFTSCDDDGWKDRTNVLDQEMAEKGELIDKLSDQINTLNTQIAQYKAEGEAAQKAADAAMAAAKDAKKAGDDAMAAAKTADAAAQLAAQSAAEAKEEAAKALKANYEELKALIDANAKEIAANKALIEGNTELLNQYKDLIDGNTVKINDNAGAIAKILESLKGYATNDQLADVAKDLNEKLEAAGVKADNAIAELNGTVAGINAAITALNGQAEALGLDITNLKKATDEQLGTLEANLLSQMAAGDKVLQDQIDALKKELANLEIASNLEQFTKFIAETNNQLDALKKYDDKLTNDLSTLAGQVSAAEKLIKENQDKIAALSKDLKAAADKAADNAKLIGQQAALIQTNKEAIEELNNNVIPALSGHIGAIDAQLLTMSEEMDRLANSVNAITPQLVTFVLDQLRGLVFIPNTFVGGIESALSYNMVYNPLITKATTPDVYKYNGFTVKGQKSWLRTASNDKDNFHPVTEVSYHMNPTSAKVEFKDLKIVSNDAEIISRASSANIALDGSYNDNKGLSIADGVLTVAINGDAPLYNASNKKMPVFALQANVYTENKEDGKTEVTTVTSDYAMFAQMDITPGAIVINPQTFLEEYGAAQARGNKEVYTKMNNVLDNVQTVNVAWNGTADLLKIMNITYTDNQRGQEGAWTTPEEWGKFNLKMNFSLIDYTIGASTVSESSWASIDPETGVITPCVNGDASKQSTDELGHMPLVYITVTEGDNVVLQGFIRIKIVPTADDYKTDVLTYNTVDFDCNTANDHETNENILNMMLEATGLSKEVFVQHYSPDMIRETRTDNAGSYKIDIMNQFKNIDGTWSETEGIGEVVLFNLAADEIKPEYHFDWYLDVEAKQKAYEGANHTGTTYVCFKSDNADVYPYVYLPMQVAVNAKPVANVEAKMEARWFRDLTTALLNVQQPTNNFQPTTIKTDLNLLWQGSKPVFKQISGQPAIKAATYATQNGLAGGYRYYFPDVQEEIDSVKFTVANKENPCLVYDHKASNANMGDHALMVVKDGAFVSNGEYSNNAIYANGNLLAELDQATGIVTLAETAEAQELLNKYASDGDGLDRTNAKLQVKVGVVAYNECGIALELKENSVIPATFLRPINIVSTTKKIEFTDAVENGSKVDVYGLLDFSDWRAVAFAGKEWLFAYYNVKSVKVNLAGMTTNAGTINSDPNKFEVDPSVIAAFSVEPAYDENGNPAQITYPSDVINSNSNAAVKEIVKKGFGKLVYDNTKLNVKQFTVKIPMTIEYGLGEFDVTVTCIVNATM